MNEETLGEIEESLAQAGFRGLFVVTRAGVVTLDGALPATDEALEALETAFAPAADPGDALLTEEAVAT